VIIVVTGTAKEIKCWAERHNLTPKCYIRIFKPTTLKQFPCGSLYVTVGEWVWYAGSRRGGDKTGVRAGAWEMILEAECLGFHLVRELAE